MIKVTLGNNLKRESVIIDENTTLRSALEAHGIDYTRGVMHLDGSSLQPGDIDKTFKDIGVDEKCFLLNVVKADNAATVKVAGSAIVIVSDLKFEDIKMVAKYRPGALVLKGGESGDEAIFAIGVSPDTCGSINNFGASFGSATHDDAKKACITISALGVNGDIKEFIADQFGGALSSLSKVEATLPGVIGEIKSERDAVIRSVVVAE